MLIKGDGFSRIQTPIRSSMVEQLPLKELVVGSSPTGWTSELDVHSGRVAKLVDAPALGAGGAILGGSSPLSPTHTKKNTNLSVFFFVCGEPAGRGLGHKF